jgi:hypothetical protein
VALATATLLVQGGGEKRQVAREMAMGNGGEYIFLCDVGIRKQAGSTNMGDTSERWLYSADGQVPRCWCGPVENLSKQSRRSDSGAVGFGCRAWARS